MVYSIALAEVFYLDGGLPAQVNALAMHALEKLEPASRFAVIVTQDPLSQAAQRALSCRIDLSMFSLVLVPSKALEFRCCPSPPSDFHFHFAFCILQFMIDY